MFITIPAKECAGLAVPQHASVTCTNKNTGVTYPPVNGNFTHAMPVDTECSFKCEVGWLFRGSTVRSCLISSKWDGIENTCSG